MNTAEASDAINRLRNLRHYDAAEKVAREALAQHPQLAMLHRDLARVFIDQGNYRSANDCIDDALALEPDSGDAAYLKSFIALRIGSTNDALERIESALSTDPAQAVYHLHRARALVRLNRAKAALRSVDQAEELGTLDADALALRADVRALIPAPKGTRNDIPQRQRDYEAVLKEDPSHAHTHFRLGRLFLDQLEQPSLAERHFRASLAANPQNAEARTQLRKAIAQQNWSERAVRMPGRILLAVTRVLCRSYSIHPLALLASAPLMLLLYIAAAIAAFLWAIIVSPVAYIHQHFTFADVYDTALGHRNAAKEAPGVNSWPRWLRYAVMVCSWLILLAAWLLCLTTPVGIALGLFLSAAMFVVGCCSWGGATAAYIKTGRDQRRALRDASSQALTQLRGASELNP